LREGQVPQAPPERPPDVSNERHALGGERGEQIRNAMLDDSRPIVTQVLVALNIIWFIVNLGVYMYKFGGRKIPIGWGDAGPAYDEALVYTGALAYGLVVEEGQWWRILAAAFNHIGLLHIGMNMYALWRLGALLERMWGRWPYLAIYLVSSVGSSLTALWLSRSNALTAGASGAICGLFGALITWILLNKSYLPARVVQAYQSMILTNVVILVIISLLPGVSWQGHLGGAVAGAVVAVPLNMARFGVGRQRILGWVGAAAVTVVGFVLISGILSAKQAREHNPEALVKQYPAATLLLKAEEVARPLCNDANKKVANAEPGTLDDAKAAELRKRFQKEHAQLVVYIEALKKSDTSERPELAEAVKKGLKFFERAADFSGKIIQSLQTGGNLAPEERKSLRAEFQQLNAAWVDYQAAWNKLPE